MADTLRLPPSREKEKKKKKKKKKKNNPRGEAVSRSKTKEEVIEDSDGWRTRRGGRWR